MTQDTTANLPAVQTFDPEDLRAISSFQDAQRLLEATGIGIADATTEIGDGFVLLDNKDELLNKPLIILAWLFADGDFGEKFSVMRIVTADGGKYVVTDGGTGIKAQLESYTQRTGRSAGHFVERGFRKSEYDTDSEGKPTQDKSKAKGRGTTHYLNV